MVGKFQNCAILGILLIVTRLTGICPKLNNDQQVVVHVISDRSMHKTNYDICKYGVIQRVDITTFEVQGYNIMGPFHGM